MALANNTQNENSLARSPEPDMDLGNEVAMESCSKIASFVQQKVASQHGHQLSEDEVDDICFVRRVRGKCKMWCLKKNFSKEESKN